MGEYFSVSPWGVEAGGGAAGIVLGQVEVTVGGGAFNGGFEGGYLNGCSDESRQLC